MKIGTENPKKVAIAVVLVLISVFFLIRGFNYSPLESAVGSQPTLQPIVSGKTPAQPLPENNLDPRLRLDLLKNSADVEYKGNGRNIFRAGAEPVKELPRTKTPPMPNPVVTKPPPPTINLKYFGFANRQGEESKVFLSEGGDVFVARLGDIVNRRYKILRITPTSVEVEDVISNVRQTLPLTQS